MLKKVAFTMYPIRDVARARRFYEETLGLKVGLNGNQGDKWWIEYDLPGGGCVALTNFIPDEPSAAAGGTIAFEVEIWTRSLPTSSRRARRFAAMSSMAPIAG